MIPIPSGGALATSAGGGIHFTFSRQAEPRENEMGDDADYGYPDGESMRRLARPKNARILTTKRQRPSLATGQSLAAHRQIARGGR